jgi:hypothetical protein
VWQQTAKAHPIAHPEEIMLHHGLATHAWTVHIIMTFTQNVVDRAIPMKATDLTTNHRHVYQSDGTFVIPASGAF